MSHTTHFDDCGCLTANYERRLDAQKEAVASLEARIATLEADAVAMKRFCDDMQDRALEALDEQKASNNALRDALVSLHGACEYPDTCRKYPNHRCRSCRDNFVIDAALAQTPAASLAAAKDSLRSHDAEVLERAAMPLLHKLANLLDAQREEEPHSLLYDTIQLGIIDTEFDIAEIRALAAQAATHTHRSDVFPNDGQPKEVKP